jgi:hypothetical protein
MPIIILKGLKMKVVSSAGLKRVIMLSSYFGDLVEMDVSENIQIVGTNTAGKTSFLKLVPVFYGIPPRKLIKIASGRKKFIPYYLPTVSSYIIYEYVTNNNRTCMVVLSADKTGETLQYFFIDSPFNKSLFIDQFDDNTFVGKEPSALKKELSSRNISHSRYFNNKEYADIIQNKRHASAKKVDSLSYGYLPYGQECKHIDTIQHALLESNFKFPQIKQLIVDIMNLDNPELSLENNSELIINWKTDYLLCQKLSASRSLFENMMKKNVSVKEHKEAVLSLYARMVMLRETLASDLTSARTDKELLLKNRDTEKERWGGEQKEYLDAHAKVSSDIKQLTLMIINIESTYSAYQEDDIDKKVLAVDNISQRSDLLSELGEKYDLLVSEQSDVIKVYDERLQALQLSHQKDLSNSEMGKEKIKSVHASENQKLMIALTAERSQAAARASVAKEKLYKNVSAVAEDIGKITSSIAFPQVDECLENEHNALVSSRQSALEKTVESEKCRAKCVGEQSSYILEKREIESALNDAELKNEKMDIRLSELQLLLDENKGTLLRFLETHVPDWETSPLAKIINEDLLMRTDLYPSFDKIASDVGIFGLSLELSSVKPIFQTTEVLREEQVSLFENIDETAKEIHTISGQLKAKENKISSVTKEIELYTVEIEMAGDALITLNAEINLSNDKLEREKRGLVEALTIDLNALGLTKRRYEKQISSIDSELSDKKASLKLDYENKKEMLVSAFSLASSKLNDEHQVLCDAYEKECDTLNKAKEKSLVDGGVDIIYLSSLQLQLDKIRKEIKRTKSWRDTVDAYSRFMRDEYGELENKKSELSKIEGDYEDSVANYKREKSQNEQLMGEFSRRDNTLRGKIGRIERSMDACNEKVERHADIYNVEGVTVSKELLDLEAETVVSRFDQRQDRLNRGLASRSVELKKAEAIFGQYANTRISVTYNAAVQEFLERSIAGEDIDLDYYKVDTMGTLVTVNMPQVEEALILQARANGNAFKYYLIQLKDFANKVNSFSRKISDSVAKNIRFDHIQKLDVKLNNILPAHPFWQPLQKFVLEYENWRNFSGQSMPSVAFSDAYAELSELIDKGKVGLLYTDAFELTLDVIENGNEKFVRNERDFESISSNGGGYLIACSLFIGMLCLYRPSDDLRLHWISDESGSLGSGNFVKLIKVLEENNLTMVSALPEPKATGNFKHVLLLDPVLGAITDQKPAHMGLSEMIDQITVTNEEGVA